MTYPSVACGFEASLRPVDFGNLSAPFMSTTGHVSDRKRMAPSVSQAHCRVEQYGADVNLKGRTRLVCGSSAVRLSAL